MSISSDSEEEQYSEMTKDQLEILEQKVAAAPLEFGMHEKYITCCGEDFARKRVAREFFSKYLLMSPTQWEYWISEEEAIASRKDELDFVKVLYERSFLDFHSPELYEQYIEFCRSNFQTIDFEKLFEQILSLVGNFFHGSQKIWQMYIDLSPGKAKLYSRRLAIPHYELSETWQSYTEWETDLHQFKINEEICKRTQHTTSEKIHFETDLVNLDKWLEYIAKETDRFTMITLFERCLLQHYKNEKVWMKYIEMTHTSDVSVYKRAVKACPYSAKLLVEYMNQLQLGKHIHQEIQEAYQRSSHFTKFDIEVLRTYCTYMNFRLEGHENDQDLYNETYQVFEEAINYVSHYFPESDPGFSLHRLWAHLICFKYGNVERAREIYEWIISRNRGEANPWYHYVNFERLLNSNDKVVLRRLFSSGIKEITYTKNALTFGEVWIEYEREFGDINSLLDAKEAIHKRSLEAPIEKLSMPSKKREFQNDEEAPSKKKKMEEEVKKPGNKKRTEAPNKKRTEAPNKKKEKIKNEALMVTVFNLPYNLIDTAIGNIFKQCGCKVAQVQLVLENARFKGTAHLQMENEDSINRALGMTDQKIHGRIITVVKYGESLTQPIQVMSNQDFRKFL